MEKATRTEITTREIQERIEKDLKGELILCVIMTAISVLVALFNLLLIPETVAWARTMETIDLWHGLFLVLQCLGAILFFFPLVISALKWIGWAHSWKSLRDGAYYVCEDRLLRIVRDEHAGWTLRGHRKTQDVFYFEKYGKVLTSEYSAVFQYSTAGDLFYLLVMRGKHPRVWFYYNQKVYEWKGDLEG